MGKSGESDRIRLEISWTSIFKVLLGILLGYVAVLLLPVFKLLILAILIAVALYPIVSRACRIGWPRWVGLLLASLTLLALVVGCVGVVAPLAYRQTMSLVEDFPRLQKQALEQLPTSGPINDAVRKLITSGPLSSSAQLLEKILLAAKTTVMGMFDFVLILVLAIYLMVDGPRTLRWLVVFFPAGERPKIYAALHEMGHLIFAYITGQFITSVLCAVYVFLILTILNVPMAFLLGVVAGIFDVLPIVGFFLAVFPAMLIGMSVSPGTALMILLLYGAYHLFEAYFIVPKVYGKGLQLSTLAVLLAIVSAGLLAGIAGAIAVLPFVAAYPVLERLWLAKRLEPDTVKEHETNH